MDLFGAVHKEHALQDTLGETRDITIAAGRSLQQNIHRASHSVLHSPIFVKQAIVTGLTYHLPSLSANLMCNIGLKLQQHFCKKVSNIAAVHVHVMAVMQTSSTA